MKYSNFDQAKRGEQGENNRRQVRNQKIEVLDKIIKISVVKTEILRNFFLKVVQLALLAFGFIDIWCLVK